ncbi:MAG TPA: IS1634 family transposase [Desulfatiglandales bacterium]|nr:IS1634 family transposase [Desulfatiglandales bacterium]
MDIPKDLRADVARLVEERLKGQTHLFDDPKLSDYVDRIVKKIQTDGKWRSERKQVKNFAEDKQSAEVFIDKVEHGQDRILGPILVGDHFWKQLHFSALLAEYGFNESQIATAELSVLHRLIESGSELSIPSWIKTVAAEEIIIKNAESFTDDRFYHISDKLLKSKDNIEAKLYQREKALFNLEDCIFLYDLTNTYFEGICARNPKAQFNGNQKEKSADCRQVVIALTLDGEGFIRKHQIFEGKMSDAKSLVKILDTLKSDFKGKQMPTIIFDRGVVSEDNIKLVESEAYGLKYIVACRSTEEQKFLSDFQNGTFKPLISEVEKKSKVEIFLKKEGPISYLLCKSQGRYAKENAMRNKREKKLEEELTSLKKLITTGIRKDPADVERMIGRKKEKYCQVAKYYKITFEQQHFEFSLPDGEVLPKRLINSLNKLRTKVNTYEISYLKMKSCLEKMGNTYQSHFLKIKIQIKEPLLSWNPIDELEVSTRALDGNYLLKTNRDDLSEEKIWNMYMMLTGVENAFRNFKSNLGLRPNRHHLEDRVDGHIFITILAYHLLHAIEFTLCKKNDHTSWPTIKRVLINHTYSTITLPTVEGPVINLRKAGIPEDIHQKIYGKLGVNYSNLPVAKTIA